MQVIMDHLKITNPKTSVASTGAFAFFTSLSHCKSQVLIRSQHIII